MGNGHQSGGKGLDSPELPADVADPLLWRSAQAVLASHSAAQPGESCAACGAAAPCSPRRLAERAAALACGDPAGVDGAASGDVAAAGVEVLPDVRTPAESEADVTAAETALDTAVAADDTAASAADATAAAVADTPEPSAPAEAALPRPREGAPKGHRPSPRPRPITA
ncbi:MAG: hypothetical protein GEU94_14920 [Micromonosporaceae bacterium]|nr:hypothetical protein [Micromonosporaceae bacterium]